ncbi:GTPase activating protein [Allomyces javanicus]|nr:GTPase activating protein [Allomyces javanicus]
MSADERPASAPAQEDPATTTAASSPEPAAPLEPALAAITITTATSDPRASSSGAASPALATAGSVPSSRATSPLPPPSPSRARVPHPNVLEAASDLLERIDPEVSHHVREMGWTILERFSRVTRASRETASVVLDHPLTRPLLPVLPRDVQALAATYRPADHHGSALEEMLREVPGASLYLAQWLSNRVIGSGVGPHGQAATETLDVWPDGEETTAFGDFEILSNELSLPKPEAKRDPKYTLTAALWVQYLTSNFKQSIPLDPPGEAEGSGSDSVDSEGDDVPSITDVIDEIKLRIYYGGIDPDVRPQVWKFLLGYLPWGSTQEEQEAIVAKKRTEFERLQSTWQALTQDTVPAAVWDEWEDRRSRIVKDVVRTDRHHPFFAPTTPKSLSREDVSSDAEDGEEPMTNQLEEEILLSGETDSPATQRINRNLIKLTHVLMTYVQYLNEIDRGELGYVQGMSDLCSVVLMLQDGDEADAFWCFVGLMERLHPNFHFNQQAMHHQLSTLRSMIQFVDFPLFKHLSQCDALNMFFVFRWLLIWFKREFSIPDVLAIWETCLVEVSSGEYQLFVALGMLELVRDQLLDLGGFDVILKFTNELSENMPCQEVLAKAEEVYRVFENKMRCVDAAATGGDQAAAAARVSAVDIELGKGLRWLARGMDPDRKRRGSRAPRSETSAERAE